MFLKNKKNKKRFTNNNQLIQKILIFSILSILLVLIISLPISAKATTFRPSVTSFFGTAGKKIDINGATLGNAITKFYDWAIKAIAFLAVVMIIVGGLQWMFAVGSAPKITAAKNTIWSAIMGLVLALSAYFILDFINPQLVRFRNLSPGEIKKIALADWCFDLPPNTLFYKNGVIPNDSTTIGKNDVVNFKGIPNRKCGKEYQEVIETNGKFRAVDEICQMGGCDNVNEYCGTWNKKLECHPLEFYCEKISDASESSCPGYFDAAQLSKNIKTWNMTCAYNWSEDSCKFRPAIYCPNGYVGGYTVLSKRVKCKDSEGEPCWDTKHNRSQRYYSPLHSLFNFCKDEPITGAGTIYSICCRGNFKNILAYPDTPDGVYYYNCWAGKTSSDPIECKGKDGTTYRIRDKEYKDLFRHYK